jgi:hypothetical protein
MLIRYVEHNFAPQSLRSIQQANEIISEYLGQGFKITIRQLYYQFVARGLLPNSFRSYKNLQQLINDARLAGKISWNAIEDRTRDLRELNVWDGPSDAEATIAAVFRMDIWSSQETRPEVWIEKDALLGVISRVCNQYRVPFTSCRGYTSQSEMHEASRRMRQHARNGQTPLIIHLGDHDPSGVNMMEIFMGGMKVNRIALNMDQIEQYNPLRFLPSTATLVLVGTLPSTGKTVGSWTPSNRMSYMN